MGPTLAVSITRVDVEADSERGFKRQGGRERERLGFSARLSDETVTYINSRVSTKR